MRLCNKSLLTYLFLSLFMMHSRTEGQILQMDIYTYTFWARHFTRPGQTLLGYIPGDPLCVCCNGGETKSRTEGRCRGVEETSGPAQTIQVHQGPAYSARTLTGQQHQVPLCTSGWIPMNEMYEFTFLLVYFAQTHESQPTLNE